MENPTDKNFEDFDFSTRIFDSTAKFFPFQLPLKIDM